MRETTDSKDAGNDWRSFWTFSTRVTNEAFRLKEFDRR